MYIVHSAFVHVSIIHVHTAYICGYSAQHTNLISGRIHIRSARCVYRFLAFHSIVIYKRSTIRAYG